MGPPANALAEAVRDAGIKVAISGEGADELFGGYEPVLRIVGAIAATVPSPEAAAAALLQSRGSIAWAGGYHTDENFIRDMERKLRHILLQCFHA